MVLSIILDDWLAVAHVVNNNRKGIGFRKVCNKQTRCDKKRTSKVKGQNLLNKKDKLVNYKRLNQVAFCFEHFRFNYKVNLK